MNPLLQLNAFWEKLEKESNLKPTSQAVYHALFQINNRAGWKENFQVVFGQVLNMAGIANVKTYYSALQELVAGGYVLWSKGPNQYKAATFSIKVLYQKTEEQMVKHLEEQMVEQGESIRHSTRLSTSNILKHINKKTGGTPPTPDQVLVFFESKQKSKNMADAFYNHYTANGWIQNKGKPIIDWQAAARGWISREPNFSNNQPNVANQITGLSGAERAQKKRELAKANNL